MATFIHNTGFKKRLRDVYILEENHINKKQIMYVFCMLANITKKAPK